MPRSREPALKIQAAVARRGAGRRTSCGVIVSDGARVLLGHFARAVLWDIPKGLAEPGEDFATAALRELREETGLAAPPGELRDLGLHRYMPGKDLALFLWRPPAMPEPAALRCTSFFHLKDGTRLPEFDRFAVLTWEEALPRLGRNMQRVLGEVRASPAWPFGPAADAPEA